MNDLADWQPRPRPQRVAIEGRYCRLEPLDAAKHGEQIFRGSLGEGMDRERYRHLLDAPMDRAAYDRWLVRAPATDDPLVFAVIDTSSGRAEGRQSLMRITPEHGVIEIGAILWGERIARTRVATEALYLHARHVFDDLGYRRFEWKCNNANAASKRAAERFGFVFEGVFRQHMVANGENRDTAWFAMLDGDWPRLRDAYERWLEPSNFDDAGRQKKTLAALRA